ncbi:MAG: NUDIX hydrolase [Bacteroidetes bacterium]|nr:NUDIX hydrolase [Bacteroidota bacterium]
MTDSIKNPWTILKSVDIHDTPWIKVVKHDVLNPVGNPTNYTTVNFKNYAIGVVPLDENYNTWIVGQYRFPVNQYSWEIPEGGGDKNETPEESAKRELSEEAGIEAKKWIKIQEFHMSNSVSDEHAFIFVAQDLSFHNAHPEENEELVLKKIPFQELYDMVLNGEITDSITIVAVFKVKYLMDNKLI